MESFLARLSAFLTIILLFWISVSSFVSITFWINAFVITPDQWNIFVRLIYAIMITYTAWHCITYEFKKES